MRVLSKGIVPLLAVLILLLAVCLAAFLMGSFRMPPLV